MFSTLRLNDFVDKILRYGEISEAASDIVKWACVKIYRKEVLYGGAGILVYVIFTKTIGVKIRHRFFAWVINESVKNKDENYEAYKKLLFEPITSQKSFDPTLNDKKALNILEIGVGSGANFSYYPDGSHLIVVDPNPYFKQYYNANRRKFPNIHTEEIIQGFGEDMSMVSDNSVDVVVMTLVMCSVNDAQKVMDHVYRVLVPGGKFFFLEHIKEWDTKNHGTRRCLQVLLTHLGIWSFFFDGCMLDRNPLNAIKKVGFSGLTYEQFYAPLPLKLFELVSPHLRGVGTK